MIGIVLDSVLMLLLVAALGYGVRLEKKLSALRAGQLAFAGAVSDLNAAAGRAQSALSDLRAAGEDADLLHDRIVKARTLKTELETLMSRMERSGRTPSSLNVEGRTREEPTRDMVREEPTPRSAFSAPSRAAAPVVGPEEERARRMQALADRIQNMGAPRDAAPGRENVSAILGALNSGRPAARAGNQSAQESINRARRTLDEDLFAA